MGLPSSGTKERFEEVAKAGAAEIEIGPFELLSGSTSERSSAWPRASPSLMPPGRRLLGASFPVCTERVVFIALFWIAENFVGFVNFFEARFRFRALLGFDHIGMVLTGKLAKGALDFILSRRLRNAKSLIVILELHSMKDSEVGARMPAC